MRFGRIGGVLFIALVTACDGPSAPAPDAGIDAGHPQQGSDARPVCVRDRDCDDGLFCNGAERCVPGSPEAASDGCVAAESPPCDETQRCDEATSSCQSTECDDGGDADGDGDPRPECGGDDCDDGDPRVYSTATEVCPVSDPVLDALDEDCDPSTIHDDDPVSGDGEMDGDGAIANRCVNTRNDGTENRGTDCDDTHDSIHPGAIEECNGFDDDCDEMVDEDARHTYYRDADGDGYGMDDDTFEACSVPDGYSLMAGDCDDGVTGTHPGATEVCNGVDDDCDDMADEAGALGETTFYRDDDGDGYGQSTYYTIQACAAPDGYSDQEGDCQDQDDRVHPGSAYYSMPYCGAGFGLCTRGTILNPVLMCCNGSGSEPVRWDYNCSGTVDPDVRASCSREPWGTCIADEGPLNTESADNCGEDVQYAECDTSICHIRSTTVQPLRCR